MDAATYDVIVVGGGSTGENVAWYATANGLSAAIVEAELVGGECSYWACMPSKALLRPSEVLAAARRVPGAAPAVTGTVDLDGTLGSRDAFTSNWEDDAQAEWVASIGVQLVRGHGRLDGERTVVVTTPDGDEVRLTADRAVVLATGSRAAIPPVDGLEDVRPWDNRDVVSATAVPGRLLVLGGGVVGVEMAQAWRRLGADVTIVEAEERLLSKEEPFVDEHLRPALEDDGIVVHTGARAQRASRDGDDGPVTLELGDGTALVGDELLVATGRTPNVDDLGLETVGLDPDGFVEVDDQLRVLGVAGDWLHAAGDVNGRALLTHQGKYQARIVGDHLGGRERSAWADQRAVPRVVFTDPQVAAVGPTEAEARDAGVRVRVAEVPLGVAGLALLGRGLGGHAKLVIDDDRDVVVGASFVGPTVGELLHAATIAVVSEVPIDRLWHAVPSFPTVSEVWLRLLEADRGLG